MGNGPSLPCVWSSLPCVHQAILCVMPLIYLVGCQLSCVNRLFVCDQHLFSYVCFAFSWGFHQFCVSLILTLCFVHVYRVNTCASCYFFPWCLVSFARCGLAHFVRVEYSLRSLWYTFSGVGSTFVCADTYVFVFGIPSREGGWLFVCVYLLFPWVGYQLYRADSVVSPVWACVRPCGHDLARVGMT